MAKDEEQEGVTADEFKGASLSWAANTAAAIWEAQRVGALDEPTARRVVAGFAAMFSEASRRKGNAFNLGWFYEKCGFNPPPLKEWTR